MAISSLCVSAVFFLCWRPNGRHDDAGNQRLCDGSFESSRGHWTLPSPVDISRNRVLSSRYRQAMYDRSYNPSDLPPKSYGRVGMFSFCSKGKDRRLDNRAYLHTAECRKLGVLEAVQALRHQPFTFVGDSIMNQQWMATALAAKAVAGPEIRWPEMVQWFCVPETDAALKVLFKRAFPNGGGPGIIVINFGMWYNMHEVSCPLDLQHQSPILRQFARSSQPHARLDEASLASLWAANQARCNGSALNGMRNNVRQGEWRTAVSDPCYGIDRDNTCKQRVRLAASLRNTTRSGSSLTQCDLLNDLVRLARFVEAHRDMLPEHVFVTDTLPQHSQLRRIPNVSVRVRELTKLSIRDAGRWRNAIAQKIWRLYAPSVEYIHLEEILLGRADSHLDLAHWCVDSVAFEAALQSLLTAIVVRVNASTIATRSSQHRYEPATS